MREQGAVLYIGTAEVKLQGLEPVYTISHRSHLRELVDAIRCQAEDDRGVQSGPFRREVGQGRFDAGVSQPDGVKKNGLPIGQGATIRYRVPAWLGIALTRVSGNRLGDYRPQLVQGHPSRNALAVAVEPEGAGSDHNRVRQLQVAGVVGSQVYR